MVSWKVLVRTGWCVALVAAAGCSRSSLRADERGSPPVDAAIDSSMPDGSTPPPTITFVLRFVSDVPESIWVDVTSAAWLSTGHWLAIMRDGAFVRKAPACELCLCDECPNCPICGQPCNTANEVVAGESVEWEWNRLEYPTADCPSDPSFECQQEVAAPTGAYTARFCWGLSVEDAPPCHVDVVDVQCAEEAFSVPDADGVVEHVVDHGG